MDAGSFEITFTSYETRNGSTVYTIRIQSRVGEHWQIEKRYSDVLTLHNQLRRVHAPGKLPRMPGKVRCGRLDPDFVRVRSAALQCYVSHLLLVELRSGVHLSAHLWWFLHPPEVFT